MPMLRGVLRPGRNAPLCNWWSCNQSLDFIQIEYFTFRGEIGRQWELIVVSGILSGDIQLVLVRIPATGPTEGSGSQKLGLYSTGCYRIRRVF